MKLYEIDEAFEALMSQMEAEIESSGEASEDTLAKLNELEQDKGKKLASIAGYIKNLESWEALLAEESRKLSKRAATHRNKAKWLRNYVAESLNETDWTNGLHSFTFVKGRNGEKQMRIK